MGDPGRSRDTCRELLLEGGALNLEPALISMQAKIDLMAWQIQKLQNRIETLEGEHGHDQFVGHGCGSEDAAR